MKIETYNEQKQRHTAEFDKFEGIFFAFNNAQFEEGMKKIGLVVTDRDKIYSIGAGGYMRKDKAIVFKELMQRQEAERKNRLKDERSLIEALEYELNNHEYCITLDPTDALKSLGLNKNDINPTILKKAISNVMAMTQY